MCMMIYELMKQQRKKTKEQVHLVIMRQFIYFFAMNFFTLPFMIFIFINHWYTDNQSKGNVTPQEHAEFLNGNFTKIVVALHFFRGIALPILRLLEADF